MTDTRQALAALIRAYIRLMETGRDRIFAAGGQCDSLEDMERSDPFLREARAALAAQPVAFTDEQLAVISSLTGIDIDTVQTVARLLAAQPVAGAVEWPDDVELEAWRSTADEILRFPFPSPATLRRAAHLLQDAYLFASHAAPQPQAAPAKPSAQGEPVAFDRMEVRAIVQQAYMALEELQGPGFLIGGVMHYRIGLILPKLNEAIDALASAPSTPPPAAVEAVPLTDEQIDALWRPGWGAYCSRATFVAIARAIERAHGIAPKAAQP